MSNSTKTRKRGGMTVTDAVIEVSRHPDGAMFYDTRVFGILPGCRKAQKLTFSAFPKAIKAGSLFGYNGEATLDPAAWGSFLSALPVVPSRIFPVEITPEIERTAREYAAAFASCPAVTSTEWVHPSYSPKYDEFSQGRA